MGAENSRYINELSDDSSHTDFDYSLESGNGSEIDNLHNTITNNFAINNDIVDTDINKEITTDASIKSFPKPEVALNLDGLFEIEKNLENYEVVSLVYMLCEDPNYALQELSLFLGGAKKTILYNWANLEQSRSKPWQKKLIEALCIIKNYQILRTLGYKKNDLTVHYLPHLPTSITELNKVKKAIYLICERLNRDKTAKFLEIVKNNMEEKGFEFVKYDLEFLELYFLHWEKVGYVSLMDISSVKHALKVMEEESLCDILESVFAEKIKGAQKQNSDSLCAEEGTSKRKAASTSTDTHQPVSVYKNSEDFQHSSPSIDQDNGSKNEDDSDNQKYEIDPLNPGLLFVINQEDFYTEIDESCAHLLPEESDRNKLELRLGTLKDKQDLVNTFKKFGFRVITKDNLTHEEIILYLKQVVKSIKDESSLFVCILSHGEKGVVYGANSCKVKVSEIQKIMCQTNKENLVGKPKILILQSCQGKACQRLNEFSDEEEEEDENISITIDGPNNSKSSVPRRVDMLTFWATVPGYAAIRNKKTGSWFIQALVKKMIELWHKHHFADICTRINSNIAEKTWIVSADEKNAMTPMVESTLTKDFYLPPFKNI